MFIKLAKKGDKYQIIASILILQLNPKISKIYLFAKERQ
jgi:hypothetical protein